MVSGCYAMIRETKWVARRLAGTTFLKKSGAFGAPGVRWQVWHTNLSEIFLWIHRTWNFGIWCIKILLTFLLSGVKFKFLRCLCLPGLTSCSLVHSFIFFLFGLHNSKYYIISDFNFRAILKLVFDRTVLFTIHFTLFKKKTGFTVVKQFKLLMALLKSVVNAFEKMTMKVVFSIFLYSQLNIISD